MALNYHEIVALGLELHKAHEDRVGVLVVFFGHGSRIEHIKELLADVPQNGNGWFLGSPGEVLDRVQDIICPGSCVNTQCRALDGKGIIPLINPPAPQKKRCKKPIVTS
jgi:hypothetical protein